VGGWGGGGDALDDLESEGSGFNGLEYGCADFLTLDDVLVYKCDYFRARWLSYT
jgi:hypothetical protein